MIFLAVDYGLCRTGLAFCDPDEKISFPLGCLDLARLGSRKAVLDRIAEIAHQKNAAAIVIGLPLKEDGSESLTTRQTRNIAKKIAARTGLPIYFMPELLSSCEAALDLRSLGISSKKARLHLDEQAACRILQSFLNLPANDRRTI